MRAEAGSIVNLGFAGDYRLLKNCPDKKGVPASRNRLDIFFFLLNYWAFPGLNIYVRLSVV